MERLKNINLITVLGPTATGKTKFAAHLANILDTEIISADSRQVYRGMDIGTGKDYQDYIVNGKRIPAHLIDIANAGDEYNVYEYQKDFIEIFKIIRNKNKVPVLCGGTGLYLQSVLKGYRLIRVPVNPMLRKELENKEMEELEKIFRNYTTPHNTTDTLHRKRLIRAIEIEEYYSRAGTDDYEMPEISPVVLGIKFPREERRQRITRRLKERLKNGMTEEAEKLMNEGISIEKMEYYGLEYKYLSRYLTGKISYEEMFEKLNTAIHQFAKRQMTWFRKMEREGQTIFWLEGDFSMEKKLELSLNYINQLDDRLKTARG